MKLIQLNTWSCSLSTAIVGLLNDENPDLITFQEVVSTRFGGKILETIDDILEAHPFKDVHYTPLVEFAFMHHRASRGNLIASQHPMSHKNEIWTHGSYTEDFDYEDSGGYNVARNIAHVVIPTESAPLHLLTMHGYHIKEHKNGNEETLKAIRMLLEYTDQLDGPIIITGDFNLAPSSESIQLLSTRFQNLSTEYSLQTTRNKLTEKTEVCDYIFVNEQVQVTSFSMPAAIVSDHNALVLEFEVPR